jgi:hypothetical protein
MQATAAIRPAAPRVKEFAANLRFDKFFPIVAPVLQGFVFFDRYRAGFNIQGDLLSVKECSRW